MVVVLTQDMFTNNECVVTYGLKKAVFVIVDEVSMMSLSMMYHLLAALPDKTKLVLVGDPDQLASVDAGTVLADIVSGSPEGRIHKLETQHRFKDAPNIVAAANAILQRAKRRISS